MTTDLFLSESNWKPFYRYSPPREAGNSSAFKDDHPKTPDTVCWFCGLRETDANPLHAAHRIPAQSVKDFAIRPEVLSQSDNFVWAHQRLCNKSVELKPEQVMWRLMSLGVQALPSFLPADTLKMWEEESKGVFAPPPAPKVEGKRFVTPTTFPTVTPSSVVTQKERRPPSGVAFPPRSIEVRTKEPSQPSGFPTVPPQSALRRRKSVEPSETNGEEVKN